LFIIRWTFVRHSRSLSIGIASESLEALLQRDSAALFSVHRFPNNAIGTLPNFLANIETPQYPLINHICHFISSLAEPTSSRKTWKNFKKTGPRKI
jgi:hypothetical protein